MADFLHLPPTPLGEPCDQCREIVRCGAEVAVKPPWLPSFLFRTLSGAKSRLLCFSKNKTNSHPKLSKNELSIHYQNGSRNKSQSTREGAFKIPPWVAPDIPSLLQVNRGKIPFGSSASSKISLPAGALFARITSATYTLHQTYSSVQFGRDVNIELNSDLVFINHGCNHSLEFDMARFEIRVVKDRPLRVRDELSFFYPSTEWGMAQPFDCRCDAPKGNCLKRIEGAKSLSDAVLSRYWLNKHIKELLADRNIGKC